MEEVVEKNKSFDQTFDLRRLVGVRVLTEGGLKIGHVSQVRINQEQKTIEGVVISRGIFSPPIFLGSTFFDKLSPEAVILKTELSILLKGKKVISYEGEVLGKIKEVIRYNKSNEIKTLVAHSFGRGDFNVEEDDIKSVGKSVILKNSYNAPKKSLFRRAQ